VVVSAHVSARDLKVAPHSVIFVALLKDRGQLVDSAADQCEGHLGAELVEGEAGGPFQSFQPRDQRRSALMCLATMAM